MKYLVLILALFVSLAHAQIGAKNNCIRVAPPAAGGIYTSTTFTGAGTASLTLTVNNTMGPLCTYTGTTFIEPSSSSTAHDAQNVFAYTMNAAQVYSLTFYARRFGRDIEAQVFGSTSSNKVIIKADLAACALIGSVTVGGTYTVPTGSVVRVNDQWCKVTAGFTGISDTSSTIIFYLWNGSSEFYSGDGVSGVAVWGVDFR